jgi:hypothetical protein
MKVTVNLLKRIAASRAYLPFNSDLLPLSEATIKAISVNR